MKNKINTENYEAFYLDYLEGNLDQETSLDLFAFLAKHPDLQVEDLGPTFAYFDLPLENNFKINLKQNIALEKINSTNIEYFLTAEKEGLLSDNKISELNAFIQSHPAFSLDRKLYALTSLQPEASWIFEPKKSLKHRETIVLWPYVAALAAASVAVLIWIWPSNFNETVRSAIAKPAVKLPRNHQNSTPKVNQSLATIKFQKNSDTKKQAEKKNKALFTPIMNASNHISGNLSIQKVNKLTYASIDTIDFVALTEKIPSSIAYQSSPTTKTENVGALTMNEVLKPVTSRLSDVIKTEVDYQTGINTSAQRKGFHLKIGQFEMYQNKSIKTQR